jgi:hypothetical protein
MHFCYELYTNIVVMLVVKSRNLVWKSCSASRSGNEGWPVCRGFGAWKRHIEHPWSPPLQKAQRWATLYNRVGVVKRHVEHSKGLTFPFVEVFGFGVAFAHATMARFQNLPVDFS